MNEVLSGAPSLDTLTKLFNTMKGYMPPDQILGWFEEYTKTKIRLRTFQGVRYDIAMTDLEWWEAREKKGEHDIGSKPIGFNPAAYKIKDNDGDLWNVVGSDGFKVTKMKKEWGNHMLKTRNLPGYTAKDIEIQMKLFVGNRWLPNKEVAEEIVEEAMGLGQTMDRLFGEKAKKAFPYIVGLLIVLGVFWSGWWLWAAMLFWLGRVNAQPMDQITELDPVRRTIAYAMIVVFVLVLTPVPFMLLAP
jgi:hypothetical protein